MSSELHEECGVFGVWNTEGTNVAEDIYYGLLSLQHRGQEAAGIAVCDTAGEKGNMCVHKELGLVSEAFNEEKLHALKGNIGIGHVRYSTTGGNEIRNAQPLAFYYLKGTLALVHNGNIVNSATLKQQLFEEGTLFKATTDSEVVAAIIAKMRAHTTNIQDAVKRSASKLLGGYASVSYTHLTLPTKA